MIMEHEILPSYVGIWMNHDKDPIEQPVYSIMESRMVFSWLLKHHSTTLYKVWEFGMNKIQNMRLNQTKAVFNR